MRVTQYVEGASGMNTSNPSVADPATHVDVDAVLDRAQFGLLPKLVLLCAGCITILDGFDIQVMGLTAPSVASEWAVDRSALAPAFAAALLGMALGGFAFGWLGDRYGRRPAMLLSVLVFGVGTMLTAFATNLTTLAVLRLLTGVGLGGALPNATALMAEFSPPRLRSQVIAAAIVGVPIGGIVGAAIGAHIIPSFGWRAMFVIGGLLPLLATVAMYRYLPESPRFLVGQAHRKRELAALLNRFDGSERFHESSHYRVAAPVYAQKAGPNLLWSRQYRRDTVALWLAFVTNLFAVYCFYNWGPVVLTSLGLSVGSAVRALLVFNLFGVIGSLIASRVISHLGSRWIQALLCVVAIGILLQLRATIGTSGAGISTTTVLASMASAGFCILGVQVTLFAVAANVYPTQCRSVGVGWAQGMGRLGGIASAAAGAVLVDSGFFASIAATLAITAVAVLGLKNHIRPVTNKS
jgi:MFS transporter, AAHS family, 4-hydroxybenzoate transporter